MTRLSAAVPVFALFFIGCSSDQAAVPAVDHSSITTVTTMTTVDPAVEQKRIDRVLAFDLLRSEGSVACGDLSLSNGTMLLDATGTELPRLVQTATGVSADQLKLVVSFGSKLPSFACTDLPSEVRKGQVDETWQATASGGTFTVEAHPTDCSVATLEAHDVKVVSPSGVIVPIGDVTFTNPMWQMWPPSECQLDQ
jgi:hypothetical protein